MSRTGEAWQVRLSIKIPKALEGDLIAASKAVFLQPSEFALECVECILATRRLMTLPPAHIGARLPAAEPADEGALDTLTDVGARADDLDAIGDIV
jgi:hypothetical protein